MEDLPLGRIAALVSEFAVKDLPLGRTLIMICIYVCVCVCRELEICGSNPVLATNFSLKIIIYIVLFIRKLFWIS